MKWFEFRQNNPEGVFDSDPSRGIGPSVWVKAPSAEKANEYAESIGIYFDGVEAERDCSCCGDRWYPCSSDEEGKSLPTFNRYSFTRIGRYNHPIFLHDSSTPGNIFALVAENLQDSIAKRLIEISPYEKDEEQKIIDRILKDAKKYGTEHKKKEPSSVR